MKIVSQEEFLKGGEFKVVTPTTTPEAPQRQSAFSGVFQDVAQGAAKGIGDAAMGAGTIGRTIQKALPDNLQGIGEVGDAGIFDTGSSQNTEAKELLKSDNAAELAGKGVTFLAELLYPASKAPVVKEGAEAVGASLSGLGSRLSSLSDDTAEGVGRIKEQLIDAVTNLDDKTKTALQRTPRDVFENFVRQGEAAMKDDRVMTPLENVGNSVIDGLKKLQEQASEIGAKKSALLEQNSGETTLDLRTAGAKAGDVFVPNKALNKIGGTVQQTAREIAEKFDKLKLDQGDTNLVNTFVDELAKLGANPTLGSVDAAIDMLQGKLYTTGRNSAVEVTDRVTGQLRKELGKLNDALKKQVGGEYAQLNSQYGEMMDVINELNARVGKEGASAGAFVKRLFSPSDARTKELFETLQSLTGQDYFRDARLAKFVMETLGDSRAKSLLEQLPDPTATSVIGKGFELIKNKLSDPIDAARRLIDKH